MRRTGIIAAACLCQAAWFAGVVAGDTQAAVTETGDTQATVKEARETQAAAVTIDLRPTWKTGEAFYIEWEHNHTSKWMQPGWKYSWISHWRYVHGYIVRVEEARNDGGARLEITLERLGSAGWWGDDESEAEEWDSDLDAPDKDNPICSVYQPAIGAKLTMEVDGQGQVFSFRGTKELRSRVVAADPDSDELAWNKDMFDEEAQAATWREWLGLYSYRPTARGEKWEGSFSTMRHDVKYEAELVRINKYAGSAKATIQTKGEGLVRQDRKAEQTSDGVVWESGDIICVSRSIFDSATNRVISLHDETKYTARQTRPDPKSGEELAFDIKARGKSRMISMSLEERAKVKREREAARQAD